MSPGKAQPGFTLIELMIVVTLVAILSMVAYPAYQAQVHKTRRADCEAALLDLAGAMERDFTLNGQYRDLIAAGLFSQNCPASGRGPYYTLASTPVGAANTAFSLTATPTGAQAPDTCGILSLDQRGTKGVSKGTVGGCW